jgi:hypothetical protein
MRTVTVAHAGEPVARRRGDRLEALAAQRDSAIMIWRHGP